MAKTKIEVEKETARKLGQLKYKMGERSYDSLLNTMMAILSAKDAASKLDYVNNMEEK